MRIIGGKWKGSILWHLQDGPVRFNDLARQLGGASKKMVNQRLKEMEEIGLVKRQVLSTRPVAVAYEITESRPVTRRNHDRIKFGVVTICE